MATIIVTRDKLTYPNKYHAYHTAITSKFSGFTQKGTSVTLHYTGSLTAEETSLILAAEANFSDTDTYDFILNTILRPARQFGDTLIDEFAAENVLLGITAVPGMTNHVRKTLREVADALRSGSLHDAIAEARAIPAESKDSVFISNARLLYFINKIEKYLNVTLSTEL